MVEGTADDRLGKSLLPRGEFLRRGRRAGCRGLGFKERQLVRGDMPVIAQMPFPKHGGAVALLFQKVREGEPARRDERLFPHIDNEILQPRPPWMAPGEQRVAGGRADRGAGMRVGEKHPLRREFINLRRGDFPTRGVVALRVPVAEIVREDHHDIGPDILGGNRGSRHRKHGQEKNESIYPRPLHRAATVATALRHEKTWKRGRKKSRRPAVADYLGNKKAPTGSGLFRQRRS